MGANQSPQKPRAVAEISADVWGVVADIVARGNKAEVEYGRDGIKVSEVKRKTAYAEIGKPLP